MEAEKNRTHRHMIETNAVGFHRCGQLSSCGRGMDAQTRSKRKKCIRCTTTTCVRRKQKRREGATADDDDDVDGRIIIINK